MKSFLNRSEIQDALLETLIVFRDVCDRHGIRYSLDCGSLLGAIRHQGFIPWDDDVDIIIPRPDYEELICHPEWFPSGFTVLSLRDDDYYFPFAKVVNLSLNAHEPGHPNGKEYLWVDLFPADAVPDDDRIAERLIRKQRMLKTVAGRSFINNNDLPIKGVRNMIKHLVSPVHRRLFPYKSLYRRMDDNARKTEFGTTKRLGNVTWGYLKASWVPCDAFDTTISVQFEGNMFKALSCWDQYLTEMYGDYMAVPDEKDRLTHSIRVWKD